VARKLNVTPDKVDAARWYITQNLYPYPLSLFDSEGGGPTVYARPDVIIQRGSCATCGVYHVEIPGSNDNTLGVSSEFEYALRARSGGEHALSADDTAWIQLHLGRARLFIASLRQRWSTLRRICEYLATYQAEFLEHGPRHLQPLTRAAVGAALGMHESTVSRAIRDKVVQLPDGRLMLLADFFDGSLAAKAAIQELLAACTTNLSDREIAADLARQGLPLARRTVAKYREQLCSPTGSGRRRIPGYPDA
jgi:RNA polymerase sigma-54 factor